MLKGDSTPKTRLIKEIIDKPHFMKMKHKYFSAKNTEENENT